MKDNNTLDPIWWFWIPVLFFGCQLLLEASLPYDVLGALHSEWGPHETLQFAVISTAFLIAATTLVRIDWARQKWLGCWFALAALCCFYVSAEEISWGQHVFEWQSSEFWHGINDQGETNLHNTSSWLDQKPRLLLLLGIAAGGLIFPLLEKYRPGALPPRFKIIYPDWRLFVVALLVVVPHLVEKLGEAFDIRTFTRVSEVQELYMFYFVTLYLWDLRFRLFSKG